MNIKVGTTGNSRIIQLGIALAVLLLLAGAVLLPALFKKKTVDKGALAFGKLPAGVSSSKAPALEARPAIGMPIGGGTWEQRFEYSWTGGAWPVLPDKLAVYRRAAGKISLGEAKNLAAKFGLTGGPIDGGPALQPIAPAGTSVPGGPSTQVAPSPAPFNSYRFYDHGKSLEISANDGRFSYMVEGAWQTVEKGTAGAPSAGRAKEIAVSFLKDKGLLPDAYTGPFAPQTGVVSSGVVAPGGTVSSSGADLPAGEPKLIEPAYREIQFGKKISAYDLVEQTGEVNRSIVSVTVGPGDVIMAASGEIPGLLEESAYPLIGPAAAFEDIKNGKFGGLPILGVPVPMMGAQVDPGPGAISGGTGSTEPGQAPVEPPNPAPEPPVKPEPIRVELNKIELAYMLITGPDGVAYYQPAYVFSGSLGAAATRSAYSLAVPAVAEKYIKRN